MSQFIEMFGNPLSLNQKNELKRLGECCILNPRRPNIALCDTDKVSFIPMPAVSEDGYLVDMTDEEYGKVKKGFTYFENNDVLFAKITPCMENGKGAIVHGLTNGIGMGSTEFHVLRPINGISSPYWLLALTRMPIFRERAAKNMSGTGGQKRVSASYLDHFMVGLPAIEEQRRFEAIYKQADKSKFGDFKSQFIEMFSKYPSETPWHKLLTIINGKVYPEEYNDIGTYPICGSAGVMYYGEKKLCDANTIILGRKGNINRPIYMESDYWIVDTAFCLDVNKSILHPKYFYYWCCQYDFTKLNKQGVLPSLTRKDLEKIEMSVPPMAEQKKFVSIAEQADKSKSYVRIALKNLESILGYCIRQVA